VNILRDEKYIRRLLIAVVIVGSLLRLFVCFQHNPLDYLFSDPLRHWLNGSRLFQPDFMGMSDPILYQVYIYILRTLTGDNRYSVALVCGILSALMPWTYYRAGREFGFPRNRALMVWALIAWTPSLFTLYHYVAMETILLPVLGVSVWMSGRFMRKDSLASWLVAVFCWTLACLTKASIVPLAVVCLLYGWFVTSWRGNLNSAIVGHKKAQNSHAVMGLLLVALLLLPNALRTRHYLGFFAPLGNSWIVKIQHRSGAREIRVEFGPYSWRFASPSVATQPLAPLSPWAIRRAWDDTCVKVKVDPARGQEDWLRAYRSLEVGWKERSLQLMENTLLFLFAPSWPDGNRAEWDGWVTHHLRWLWAPLIFFVLDCNFREFRRRQFNLIPVVVTLFILFLAFQNIVTMEGRYRKPLEPLLLLNLVWSVMPPTVSTRCRDGVPEDAAG